MKANPRAAVAILLVVASAQAQAGCGDPPAPGVDWSGCTKSRLVLKGRPLMDAKFDRAVLLGVNFAAADLARASFRAKEY